MMIGTGRAPSGTTGSLPSASGSPAKARRSSASCSSNRRPRVPKSRPVSAKSSARPPAATPRVSRPPVSSCTVAACLASSAVLRVGATRMFDMSPMRSVTAPAAARTVSSS